MIVGMGCTASEEAIQGNSLFSIAALLSTLFATNPSAGCLLRAQQMRLPRMQKVTVHPVFSERMYTYDIGALT